jgi:hypothetical protein
MRYQAAPRSDGREGVFQRKAPGVPEPVGYRMGMANVKRDRRKAPSMVTIADGCHAGARVLLDSGGTAIGDPATEFALRLAALILRRAKTSDARLLAIDSEAISLGALLASLLSNCTRSHLAL